MRFVEGRFPRAPSSGSISADSRVTPKGPPAQDQKIHLSTDTSLNSEMMATGKSVRPIENANP
jgi:hypothetical protein